MDAALAASGIRLTEAQRHQVFAVVDTALELVARLESKRAPSALSPFRAP